MTNIYEGAFVRTIFKFLATGLDVGYIPGAPGTYGTLVAVVLYYFVAHLPVYLYILFAITFVFFSVWVTKGALPYFEGEDPEEIVIDEIAGYIVTMIGLPFSWIYIVLGFVFFRVFDVLKPFPIRWFDRNCEGALGVVLDDVAAGIFSCICLWAIRLIFL